MSDANRVIHVDVERWPLRSPFRITGSTMSDLDVVLVKIMQDGYVGRGEATGVDYLGDDVPRMLAQIESARSQIEHRTLDREQLMALLPPGGARNAVDCALWELESKRLGRPVWKLAGIDEPRPLLTTYTLGADEPDNMAAGAKSFSKARAIKVKLTGEPNDAQRVRAIREARPDVWLAVDANQGFTREHFKTLLPTLLDADVKLIEQPFAIGKEPTLAELGSPILIAADESVQDLRGIPALTNRFNMINIKLDKCGGLTEALLMAREAQRRGLRVMVGNMVGTSLAMAPGYLVGQCCEVVDLDGPLLLREDRPARVDYSDGRIHCDTGVWGSG